jgi:hypothetical protein
MALSRQRGAYYDSDEPPPGEEWYDTSYLRVGNPARTRWVEQHYDVLEELYNKFLESGRGVFTDAFYQFGGFHTFVWHVYHNTRLGGVTGD